MRFDGPTFARAWLAVTHAASSDPDLYMLYRAVAIEVYPNGVRLVSTDRRILLTAWVPDLEHTKDIAEDDPAAPELDWLPDRTVVTRDEDHRGRSILSYVLGPLLGRWDREIRGRVGLVTIDLIFDASLPEDADADETLDLEGVEATYTVLEIPDTERVYMPIMGTPFPDWRPIVGGFTARRTEKLTLNPEVLERLSKVRKYAEGGIDWRFGGKDHIALVEYASVRPRVSGVFMPMKLAVRDIDDEGALECRTCAAGMVCLRHSAGVVTVADLDNDNAIDLEVLVLAIDLVASSQFGSTSMLQRKLRIRYAQAENLMTTLEGLGVVGPAEPGNAREVLVRPDESKAIAQIVRDLAAEEADDDDTEEGADTGPPG